MNEEFQVIRIIVRLTEQRAFSSELLRHYLAQVERAVFQAEMLKLDRMEAAILDELKSDFAAEPPGIEVRQDELSLSRDDVRREFDALRYRAKEFKNRTFNVDKAATGSIILEGMALSLAYWLFDKTAGEAAKEAFKKTKAYGAMVSVLSKDVADVAQDIKNGLKKAYRHRPSSLQSNNFNHNPNAVFSTDDVDVAIDTQRKHMTIVQTIAAKEEQIP